MPTNTNQHQLKQPWVSALQKHKLAGQQLGLPSSASKKKRKKVADT
jgi:hypothetical protein